MMNGITLIIIGGILTTAGILVGVYSIIFEITTGKKIKEQMKAEYNL